jgi:hypothetical protein
MPNDGGLNAARFRDAFLASYFPVRSKFTDERWMEVWTHQWSSLMLWQTTPEFHPLPEIEQSVLVETANVLSLQYENGEPLRLDAVFTQGREPGNWFPILAAVEHENVVYDFASEVKNLLSVRCPLKVGITYTTTKSNKREAKLRFIEQTIQQNFTNIRDVVREDPESEYLFLVGTEIYEFPRELFWYYLDFSAAAGPENKACRPVYLPGQEG